MSLPELAEDTRRLCQALLRMDTTNPPGNERICAQFLERELREVGLEPVLLEAAPARTNLVVRHRGTGKLPPLLLTAHLDVVEADPSKWRRPPFSGDEFEGCLWGRGAIDMKNMAAMCTAIMRRLAASGTRLDRDVIFAAVADEEAGCDLGSRFLVEQHEALVKAEYAIGESGGFSLHLGDTTFYPIQVAEKGLCWVRARWTGEPGHGSMPRPDSAVLRMAAGLAALGKARLPVHPTSYLSDFLDAVAVRQPAVARPLVRLLSRPELLARLLRLRPDAGIARSSRRKSAVVCPGRVRPSISTSATPGMTLVLAPARTTVGDAVFDSSAPRLRAILGADVELEVMREAPPTVTEPVASALYDVIARQVVAREPDAVVVPYMIPGFTDAKYFTQLGARWYGFSPVKIEADSGIRFADMFHGHDERIPIAGLHWGAEVLDAVVREFAAAG